MASPTPRTRPPAAASLAEWPLRVAVALAKLLLSAVPALAQEVETITVLGTTPVRADGTTARDFPGVYQSATAEQLAASGGADISSYLNRSFGGVHIHSAQGNPLQPDLYFRGYAASPLLGLPMGLTVYQNGVRLNEPWATRSIGTWCP